MSQDWASLGMDPAVLFPGGYERQVDGDAALTVDPFGGRWWVDLDPGANLGFQRNVGVFDTERAAFECCRDLLVLAGEVTP